MRIEVITTTEAAATTVALLRLDPATFAVHDTETVAAAVRRTASFRCPTTPRALADEVIELLDPLGDERLSRADVNQSIEQLISVGDLVELPDISGTSSARLLYLGPPSFIEREPGRHLVVGIRPLGAPLLPEPHEIDHAGYLRTAHQPRHDPAALLEAGLHGIRPELWAELPATINPHDYVSKVSVLLESTRPAGFVSGLRIIDPSALNHYYRGRWREPVATDTGSFVGRRPQAYGADQWCFVRIEDGQARTIVDLPNDPTSTAPGRDEAWRLQCAIDASRGAPVPVRIRRDPGDAQLRILDFYSPLPTWAQRYVDLRATPCDRSTGALFSLRVAESNVDPLLTMLTTYLWLSPMHDGGTT